MTELTKSQLIQNEIDRSKQSIQILSNLSEADLKGYEFMYYAEYDVILHSFQMKNAAYLEKKMAFKSKRQQNQEVKRKLKAISDKNHSKIIKEDNLIDRTLNRLETSWDQKGIPDFHRFYFHKYIDNNLKHYLDILAQLILNEEKLIKNDCHILYSLERAVRAREACLLELKQFLAILREQDIHHYIHVRKERLYYLNSNRQKLEYRIQGYKINKVLDRKVPSSIFEDTKFQLFGVNLSHLAKLTVHVISLISKWREYLYSLTIDPLKKKENIEFYFEEENYLLRIINDNDFLQKSFLSNFYKFAPKNDPFLLRPIMEIENQLRVLSQELQNSSQAERLTLKVNEYEFMKKILTPRSLQQLGQINTQSKVLLREYQLNIRNRKIFDLKLIHRIENLELSKVSRKSSKESKKFRISSLEKGISHKLPDFKNSSQLIEKHSKSQSKLRLRKQQASLPRQNSLLQMKNQGVQKTNIFSDQKEVIERNNSNRNCPLKPISNPEALHSELLNHQQLEIIKKELREKIKRDLNINNRDVSFTIFQKSQMSSFVQKQATKLFLESKYKKLHNEQESKLSKSRVGLLNRRPIRVETYSVGESELIGHLHFLFQEESSLSMQFLQPRMDELLKGMQITSHQIDSSAPSASKRIQSHQMGIGGRISLHFLRITSLENSGSQSTLLEKSKVLTNLLVSPQYRVKESSLTLNHAKQIQVLYMTVKSGEVVQIERNILKAVEFLFKYETASAIIFTFFYTPGNQQQQKTLLQLKSALTLNNCIVAEKQIGVARRNQNELVVQKLSEVKFKFMRTDCGLQQIKNLPSRESVSIYKKDPASLLVELHGMVSSEKMNENGDLLTLEESVKNSINYDYLLTEYLMNHLSSKDFVTLRNRAVWANRFKIIIQNIIVLQKQLGQETSSIPFLPPSSTKQASNLTELNRLLQNDAKSTFSTSALSDLVLNNTLKIFSLRIKLTLPYLNQKAFIDPKTGERMFRFNVNREVPTWRFQVPQYLIKANKLRDSEQTQKFIEKTLTDMLIFSTVEHKNVYVGIFDTTLIEGLKILTRKNSQGQNKSHSNTLADLLNIVSFESETKNQSVLKIYQTGTTSIRNLYIPMVKPVKKDPNHSSNLPFKIDEFKSIQEGGFYIAENVNWNYDIHLESGLRFKAEEKKGDRVFRQGKSAIVVWLMPQKIVIYSRLL